MTQRTVNILFISFYIWAFGTWIDALYPNYRMKNVQMSPIVGFDLKTDSIIVNKNVETFSEEAYTIVSTRDSMYLLDTERDTIGRVGWTKQYVGIDSLILNDIWSNE